MKKTTLALTFLFLISFSLYADDTAEVLKVIDGDTIKVRDLDTGREEKVRLIGIDTPESRRNAKAKRDAGRSKEDLETIVSQGKAATKFVKSLVKKGDLVGTQKIKGRFSNSAFVVST